MKQIPLTRGLFAIIDDDDFDKFGNLKWQANWSKCTKSFYATRRGPPPKRRRQLLHRVVMGDPSGMDVDHENHNTLDCRRSNLRASTRSQNAANRLTCNSNSKSGIRGVHLHAGKWQATIRVNYKLISLGHFASKPDAARARAFAAKKYFGEFSGRS